MKSYLLYSMPFMSDEKTPMFYVDAENEYSLIVDIRPFDPADADAVRTAAAMKDGLKEPDASTWATVGRLAVSYGGISYADGSPLETSPVARQRPNRREPRRG